MAHKHGGDFDPTQTYTTPPPAAGRHGGSYTPPAGGPQGQPIEIHPVGPPSAHASGASLEKSGPAAFDYHEHHQGTAYPQQQQQYYQHGYDPQAYYQQQGPQMGPQQAYDMGKQPSVAYGQVQQLDGDASLATPDYAINLKGHRHILHSNVLFRWIKPRYYKPPGYKYHSQDRAHRHRDFVGRVKIDAYSDRYLHHADGRLRKLIVSCTDPVFEGPANVTWRRTYVRIVAPRTTRLAMWVVGFRYDPANWMDWFKMLARAFPVGILMQFVILGGGFSSGNWRNGGKYPPVLYSYWGSAKVWSNLLENRKGTSHVARNNNIYRMMKPRHLCFLNNPYDDQPHGVQVRSVAEWEATDGQGTNLSYIFVAYSTRHFAHDSIDDMKALCEIAERAARAAKVMGYWLAASCMREEAELEDDVHRIADVLRGAQAMVIAVGQSHTKGKTAESVTPALTDALLADWGTRMWTFPEALLSPGLQIAVYTRGAQTPLLISKNQFASRVWNGSDSTESKELIDHYLGTLSLSSLELAVTALKCLYSRKTTEYLAGDQAYALMGLLSSRPQVDKTDSPFQAFSRLSLANDSDELLERYLCTMPLTFDQPWHDMRDAYQSALWDIEPYCQVAGICDNDVVILDGARGASIRWKSFYPVGWATGGSWKRTFALIAMQNQLILMILAIVFIAISVPPSYGDGLTYTRTAGQIGLLIIGLLFLLGYILIFFNSPRLIRTIHRGKLIGVQAALFAFEGHLNAPTVEHAIFGGTFGRMGWSANGSPLSRSYMNEFNERVGVDPTKDPAVMDRVERARHARPGEPRIFTLVDTFNMQLTLFEAVRPPVCVFLCAAEGGMQRAVGCSYDWTTQTFYRETVLRMPTESLNSMDRVPRFRMGIQRQEMPSSPADAIPV